MAPFFTFYFSLIAFRSSLFAHRFSLITFRYRFSLITFRFSLYKGYAKANPSIITPNFR